MAAMALLLWIFPRELITLFLTDVPANARVIQLGVSFLAVAAAFQIVDGAQVVGAGMLRGLHDTRVPMLFALFGYWVVGLGVGVWLAFDAGLERRRHLDRAGHRPGRGRGADDRPLDDARSSRPCPASTGSLKKLRRSR